VGCFLEFLYTGDYFPRKLPGQRALEADPSVPSVDETGDQLLKHARVYTVAEKFGVDKLKSLATSKIHCIHSTAKGEIAYARYVYTYTSMDDTSIRAPIANFWATRSHTLRSEAEDDFRSLCLEYPQFGYDVLSKSPETLSGLALYQLFRLLTNLQLVCWTRSSSARPSPSCTQQQDRDRGLGASELGTAMYKTGNILFKQISQYFHFAGCICMALRMRWIDTNMIYGAYGQERKKNVYFLGWVLIGDPCTVIPDSCYQRLEIGRIPLLTGNAKEHDH
jgi:hypothetical protein